MTSIDKHWNRVLSLPALVILLGLAGWQGFGVTPVAADEPAYGTDRAGDALSIDSIRAAAREAQMRAGDGSRERATGGMRAAYGTDRAGDALSIDSIRAAAREAQLRADDGSRTRPARGSQAAYGTNRAGDALPVGTMPHGAGGPQRRTAELESGQSVN